MRNNSFMKLFNFSCKQLDTLSIKIFPHLGCFGKQADYFMKV